MFNTAEPDEYDVVVAGAGAAGMTAALTAAKLGLSVVVVEKAPTFGGSTARSGGEVWLPNNSILLSAGVSDTMEQATAYLSALVGPDVPNDRQQAFLTNGPKMLDFVMANGPLRFRFTRGYSDYYPNLPGGMPNGRSIEPKQFNGNLLGAELKNLNRPYMQPPRAIVVYCDEYKWLNLAAVNFKGIATSFRCMMRAMKAALRRERPLTMGPALAAGLRVSLLHAKVPVWLNSPLIDLIQDGDVVTGVTVQKDGVQRTVQARKGVIICSGGFEHNADMRSKYQQQPTDTQWSVGAKENTGDGIRAGEKVGAALGLMDDAWWGPSIPLPGQPYFCLTERAMPGALIVNGCGKRFVNEAAPYCEFVHTMYKKDRDAVGSHIPAWLIMDQNCRNKYFLKDIPGRFPIPKFWYESGVAKKASTLEELANQIGVPDHALTSTINRFNGQARIGIDDDFHRGDVVYDHYFADPKVSPNSCLAPIESAPFYSFKIVPGDLGTKGGIVTDAHAKALRTDGSVIRGLWVAGNASSAVMGHSYAGPGSTLGPAMTFGFIAANDIINS
ncbi:hypothetical protein BGZ83_010117 [Gryganskiella cystojenkinii]|nr:hypothetical protein BGZ83_010117 [Gryganskiella cystojenkinii]